MVKKKNNHTKTILYILTTIVILGGLIALIIWASSKSSSPSPSPHPAAERYLVQNSCKQNNNESITNFPPTPGNSPIQTAVNLVLARKWT